MKTKPTFHFLRPNSGLLALLFLLISGYFNSVSATHAAGSDIKYRCLGGLMYEIEVTFYRDCGGVSEPSTITVNCKSVSGNHNLNITASKVAGSTNGQEITVPCVTSNTTCNGGSTTGVRKWVYRATVTLPSARADWVFSYNVCCRNCTITTINNPCASNSTLYVEATLNNLTAPCNSSPTFSNIPIAFVCIGQNFNYNHGVLDPDGDSLVYSLITPKTTSTSNVTFLAPANVNNPIASSTPFTINATTGDLNFTPSQLQIGIMAILVREYRNNQLIGSVIRDMQVYTQACTNNLPTLGGINGTSNFTINACPGQQICFTVQSADLDTAQIISLTTNNGIPNATYTISGGSRPTLTFCWTPTLADISLRPKTFTITVRDNSCPTNGIQTFSYSIYVPGPNFTFSSTNVNCNGTSTGSASVFPVYSGSYTYLWSNGATSSGISNIPAGTYTVTATDPSTGCTATKNILITEPGGMVLSATSVQPSCSVVSNGAVDLNVSGGNPPYTYTWSNGANSQDLSNVSAGTYTVTVTDASGCTQNSVSTLIPAYSVTLTSTTTPVNCFGITSGAVTSSVNGGVSPYTYNWNTGASTSSLNNLGAGTYTVTVTDVNGCTAISTSNVTQPVAPLTMLSTTLPVNCFGESSGSFSTSVSGGTPPYTYSWSNGNSGSSAGSLMAGTYTVTVTDNNGCSITDSKTISQPLAALSTSSSQTNVSCFGQNTGSITLNLNGGTSPYSFQWNNGANTQNITNLTVGTYTATVTDANGCTNLISRTISGPSAALSATTSSTNDVNCFDGNNGSISLALSGGTAPYTYLWSNGSTTQNLSGLSAGTYSVTVRDANNCTSVIASIGINQPSAALTANSTKTNVACFGNASGAINLNVNGGTAPYTYVWSHGATTQNVTGLTSGTYSVTITDSRNCITGLSIPINQPSSALNIVTTKTNVRCFGNSTGLATASTSGGVGPYTYTWSNGATTASVSNLTAGNYTVTATDANGCTSTTLVSITQPAAGLAVSGSTQHVSCYNVATGAVSTSASGGTAPYTYQWNNGQNTSGINNLQAGTYTITTTDAQGCSATGTYTISQPAAALSVTATVSPVSCYGGNSGSSTVTANGGTSPYTYSWSNGATGTGISNLNAGTYQVTVSDANGCTGTATANIAQPAAPLSLLTSVNSVNCFGGNNGSAAVTPGGGTGPYTYSWSNGFSTPALSSLAAGIYSVVVSDANGCTQSATLTIQEPASSLQLSATSNDINCTGNSIGSIDLSVLGGTTPYTYAWSNGSNQQDVTNLSASTYTVTVTDANGCTSQLNRSINQPAGALNVSSSVNNLLCFGDTNGSINLTATAGTPPYSYQWNTGSTGEDQQNLTAGAYTVTVTDNNGCSLTNNLFVTQPQAALQATASTTAADCFGNASGSINLSVSGGTPGYSFNWNHGTTQEDLQNLSAGTYQVLITDLNGCTTGIQALVTQPAAPLSLNATQVDLNCHDIQDGALQITASGGTPAYAYTWNTGATSASISNLATGNYTLTVTDANGCAYTQNYNISYAAPVLTASANPNAALCHGHATGSIDLTANGGTPPFLYKWNTGDASEDLNNLTAGSYSVTITDANGCLTTATATVIQPSAALTSFQSTNPVLCFGDATGLIDFNVNGGTYPYSYLWSNGETTEDLQQLATGDYSVTVTDANGCTLVQTINIPQPGAPLQSGFSITHVACNGDSSGIIASTVTGGTLPYVYSWDTQANTPLLQGLSAGTYILQVTDSNGCTLQESVTINEPAAALSSNPLLQHIDCNGNSSGSANLQASGGTGPYSFTWSNGQTQETITGLAAGSYTYTVTDANSCSMQGTITIDQPVNALSLSTQVAAIACNGDASGTIDLTVSGGTPSYTFLWSDGSTSEDLNNLTAGNYTVTVTDINNCVTIQTISVQQPPSALGLIDSLIMVNCTGGQDAEIQLTANGGTAPYSFAWNNGANTANLNNLTAGSYSVLVSDANGCTLLNSYTITEPVASLNASGSSTAVLCYGDSTASIDMTVTGGTSPYTYAWNTGSSSEDLFNITAGTYTLIVTDANHCTYSETIQVIQPLASLLSVPAVSQVLCTGDSSGAVQLTTTGGTAPYSYLWNNGHTTQNPSGMQAGTYTVSVSDANGCSTQSTITIPEPDSLISLNANIGHIGCNGQSTGWINLDVSGGTGAYTYLWNNGSTSEDPGQLLAGTYTVTVSDQNGCTAQISAQITQPAAFPNVSGVTTPVSCLGMQNGAVHAVVSGGTTPYTYLWNTGANTDSITAIGAGVYTVTVTDANGCSSSYTTRINEPASALTLNGSVSPADCISGSLGNVSAQPAGGTAPYTYLWSNGSNGSALSNQVPGSYTVTVFDANGCESTQSFVVGDVSNLNLTADGDVEVCMGQSVILRTDSIPEGTLQWYYNGVALNGATAPTFITPVAGTYTVTATTPCGVYTSNPVDVISRTLNGVSINNSVIICTGESTPLHAGGGTEYTWSPVTGLSNPNSPDPIASPLQTTEYTVTVKDEFGCTATASVTVTVMCDTLDIPNGFSPNEDGTNDTFVIDGIGEYPGNVLFVYNRWGNLVYKKRDYDNSWNGESNVSGISMGSKLVDGTYYFILDLNLGEKPINGYVVLRR